MSTRATARRLAQVVAIALTTLVAPACAYLLAALVLGVFHTGRSPSAPADGPSIFVLSNGVHTDLLVPMSAFPAPWRSWLAGTQSEEPYLALGWGDRDFYLQTPSWSDLRLPVVLHALSGRNPSVMHVQPSGAPSGTDAELDASTALRRIRVSPAQLDRLVRYLEASFARDEAGQPELIAAAHYQRFDRFFVARGHYSPLTTCNEWVRRGLEAAGVRVPLWSPFAAAIFYQLPAAAATDSPVS